MVQHIKVFSAYNVPIIILIVHFIIKNLKKRKDNLIANFLTLFFTLCFRKIYRTKTNVEMFLFCLVRGHNWIFSQTFAMSSVEVRQIILVSFVFNFLFFLNLIRHKVPVTYVLCKYLNRHFQSEFKNSYGSKNWLKGFI